jgi:hypothetical protein
MIMNYGYVKNSEGSGYVVIRLKRLWEPTIVVLRFELDILFRIHLLEAYHCASLTSYSSSPQ